MKEVEFLVLKASKTESSSETNDGFIDKFCQIFEEKLVPILHCLSEV